MIFTDLSGIDSPFRRFDPRVRICVMLSGAIVIAVARSWSVVLSGLVIAVICVLVSRVPFREFRGKMFVLNMFVLMIIGTTPWGSGGETLFRVGDVCSYEWNGLVKALLVGVKANTILLLTMGLTATIDVVTLGHALSHLRVPAKLSHLFMFSVRFLDVIHREYLRLKMAMKVRGFHAGMNLRTYKTLACFAGVLIVRSVDRSERVENAMKCRGFHGDFHLFHHFRLSGADLLFGGVGMIVFIGLAVGEVFV